MPENETPNLEKNVKLFPIYKSLSWDLFFYYAIIFLFLTKTKNMTAAQVMFADAFYPLSKLFFQLICVHLTDKIGTRKSILLGNIFVDISLVVILFCVDVKGVILANILFAFAYSLKELCEPTFLNYSITQSENRREIFAKVDGRASSMFYLFDSVSAVCSGFFFVLNHYLPIILCLTLSIIATFIAFNFEDLPQKQNANVNHIRNYLKDLRDAFKYIFNSKRLRALMIFSASFTSLIVIFKTYMSSLLVDFNLPDKYFGIITAIIQLVASISAKRQGFFQNKYGNRVLTVFSIPFCLSIFIVGIVTSLHINLYVEILLIGLMILIYAIVKGPYYVLIKKYLNSFSNSSLSIKIYAANTILDSMFRFVLYLISSYLLGMFSTAFTLLIVGGFLTILFMIILEYMKTRVGLQPEEYRKSDIEF